MTKYLPHHSLPPNYLALLSLKIKLPLNHDLDHVQAVEQNTQAAPQTTTCEPEQTLGNQIQGATTNSESHRLQNAGSSVATGLSLTGKGGLTISRPALGKDLKR
jgi:hypothetical protein